jgi:hypothetical protein
LRVLANDRYNQRHAAAKWLVFAACIQSSGGIV